MEFTETARVTGNWRACVLTLSMTRATSICEVPELDRSEIRGAGWPVTPLVVLSLCRSGLAVVPCVNCLPPLCRP